MKMMRKVTSLTMAAALMICSSSNVYAAPENQKKEEVVYIMTDNQGNVEGIDVVNIFGKGQVTDYGNYSEVKLLNSREPITAEKGKICFEADQNRTYYQGTMDENTAIPWNISLKYYLNEKEITAKEAAGKSGRLKIRFQVTQNKKCDAIYFEKYALQASFTLDTNYCANIVAEDATQANVGNNKQLTYTILPNKGIDTVITMDVTDFEMEPVAINGIALNMDVEIDDEELTEKIDELMDATKELNNGAFSVSDGADSVKEGGTDIKDGTEKLYSGVTGLDEGLTFLQEGIETVQSGLDTLNANSSSLTSGSAEVKNALKTIQQGLSGVSADTSQLSTLVESSGLIREGISNLNTGIDDLQAKTGYVQYKQLMKESELDIEELQNKNQEASEKLGQTAQMVEKMNTTADLSQTTALLGELAQNADSGYQESALAALTELQTLQNQMAGLQDLKDSSSSLSDASQLLQANNGAYGGMESYLNGVSEGITGLKSGAGELQEKDAEFDAGVQAMAATLSGMMANMKELSDGINTLTAKYEELDKGINDYTAGVAAIVSGYSQLTDGVSSLAAGSKELLKGAGNLDEGASKLLDGVTELCDGASELADGTNEMYNETSDMDVQLEDKMNEILDSIGGGDFTPVSFTSAKNKDVKSVQFVIKTGAIEKETVEEVEENQQEDTSFWQKFIRLFQ